MLGVSSAEVGAAVLQQMHAQGEHATGLVGRKGGRLQLIAPCHRRDHVLGARLDPLDGPAGEARDLREHELLGVDVDLGAEAAAHVGRDDAHLGLGDAADGGHERAHEVRHLRRGVERQLAARGDPVGHHAARLDGHGGEALVVDRQRHLHGRGVEDGVEALGLVLDRQAVVAGRLLVQLRRIGLAGVLGVDHDRQRVVVDDDAVGGVTGQGGRIGDHDCNQLADHPHLAVGQDRPLGLLGVAERVRGAGNACFEPQRVVGEDVDHAGHRCGRRGVDAADHGVRVRRAQEGRVGHVGQLDVVDVPALAGDQRRVFLAQDRCADAGVAGGGSHRSTPSPRRARH